MSVLPDGLPDTCLGCEEVTVDCQGKYLRVVIERDGNVSTLLVSMMDAAEPFIKIASEQLD
jgi:hypothetical protein